MNLENLRQLADTIGHEISKAVYGQSHIVDLLLVSLFARGHCLLEGPPGTAKTLLAQSLATALDMDFKRIQFTPDLMPGDVIGTNLFDFKTSTFNLIKGPVFTDILLADEINRAPPKTQSALLQVMNERKITIDGADYSAGELFFVIATQNPIESQGTYPLPEAQLDRFLFKLPLEFPARDDEFTILQRHARQALDHDARRAPIEQVAALKDIAAGQDLVDGILLDDKILNYVLDLVRATREDIGLTHGASTRAADALCGAVRAAAALDGRDYAIPDDVKRLFVPAIAHRLVVSSTAEIEGRTAVDILDAIQNQVAAPR
ncbi:MAG: MoxR family ATPase [Pseudomonadota bacterium]